ncbi:MAG: class I SAM-dependent methyltransferase [Acidobacteriota bacterium]|nr:class I SAM-dependent methyltransferase [Blastocatellia bacterium]MDW8412295.1 class I SAM-dependent methyltransferase [Acidobacteriota bacterium]
MFELENDYWWFVARRNLVVEVVNTLLAGYDYKASIFDVGCGTGATLEAIQQYGEVFGTDMAQAAIEFCRKRGLQRLAISRLEQLGYLSESFDLVTALDVLEHVDQDLKAMAEIYRILKPGGAVVITVPAYGFLWSEHDEALHHRRRYAAYELRNKLSLVGFEIERCSYFISTLFFPILIIRILQGIFKKSTHPKTSLVRLPKLVNSLLIYLLKIEQLIFRYINLPFGVSLVCIAKKPLEQPRSEVLNLLENVA